LIWHGLKEGIIDMVVTDHSPCPPEMKLADQGDFRKAWGGIASLSMALPVMWTEVKARGFALSDLVRWMSEKPAKLAGCESSKGRIAAGSDADLVVFDPEAEFTVTGNCLHHRHAVSPYLGEVLYGAVRRTYLRGTLVFDGGTFSAPPSGHELPK
jgi:allantoinase